MWGLACLSSRGAGVVCTLVCSDTSVPVLGLGFLIQCQYILTLCVCSHVCM